ncbi:hypothetical protein BDW02DRAFT_39128 [Decorospora gaudefroyi]|uniref:Uncharacterized protein n=1 Tax=Decorospora gaudefroyi TaxID=184978 RepID=A0A6A5K255_9PLEO|nr:hypothetical protein BDW02DRAFT_39128 [Decorospora gaudefroyi]
MCFSCSSALPVKFSETTAEELQNAAGGKPRLLSAVIFDSYRVEGTAALQDGAYLLRRLCARRQDSSYGRPLKTPLAWNMRCWIADYPKSECLESEALLLGRESGHWVWTVIRGLVDGSVSTCSYHIRIHTDLARKLMSTIVARIIRSPGTSPQPRRLEHRIIACQTAVLKDLTRIYLTI